MRKIAIEKSGSPAWTRYLIHDDQGRYWSGETWAEDRRAALLYADWNLVSHEYRILEERQWSVVPARDFGGSVRVKVWSGTGFTAEQLRDYLHEAVMILLDHDNRGTGPVPDSLLRIDIDWAEVSEVREGGRS